MWSSMALYALSLALPALSLGHPAMRDVGLGAGERGYVIMATGWAGVLFAQFGWFANAFWATGLIYLSRRRWNAAALAATLGALLAANTFTLYRTGVPSDSGRSHATAVLPGFWVWWASLWVLAVGAILLWRRHRGEPDSGEGSFTS